MVSNASRYRFFRLSGLYLPGELVNESISEVETPSRRIQLSLNGRMIIRMLANGGDLQFNVGSEPRYKPDILHIYKASALSEVKEVFGILKNTVLV